MASRGLPMDTTDINSLNNAISQLYSSKPAERKRGLENLGDLLFDSDAVAFVIDSNSLNVRSKSESKVRATWDSIFEAVQSCYDQANKTTLQSSFSLLQRVVKRGNTYGPYVSCEPLYDFILAKLNDHTLPDASSYGFMTLLQNLLSLPVYTASFRGNHWKHIILTLIDLYKNSNIPKTMILETLNVSIIHGSNIPDVILVLRKEVVRFYRYVCLEEQNRHYLPTVLINRGIVLLCRYNAIEFRGILCGLGEMLIPAIIPSVTNSTRDHEEEGSVIDVLLVQIQLHAPLDHGPKSPAFYAENRGTWDEVLDKTYSFVVDLIEEIAKKSGYTKNVTIPANLLSLAVKVTKLIHDRKSGDEGQTGGDLYPAAKRHMTQKSFHAIVNETLQHQPCEAAQLVWIQYISAVLSAFPEIADSSTLAGLHRLGASLLNSAFIAYQEVYVFLRSILAVEKYLKAKGTLGNPNSWDHIWDIVIKSLEVNGAKAEALEFIRSLLIQEDCNINSLLFLFVENGLAPRRESLHLLSEFLSRCTLPEYVSPRMRFHEANRDKSCPRLALIKWIVGSLLEKCLPNSERDLARVLVSLLVKRSALFMQIETEFDDSYQITPPFQAEFEDFEPWLVRGSFVATPKMKQRARKHTGETEGTRVGFTLLEGIGEKLHVSLQEDLEHSCPPLQADADFPKKLPILQYRLGVLVHVLNFLHLHNLGDEADLRSNISELFDTAFRRYASLLLKFLGHSEVATTTLQMYSVLEVMHSLLHNPHLIPKVKQMLASKYTTKLQDFWKHSFWRGLPNQFGQPHQYPQHSPTKDFVSLSRRASLGGDHVTGKESEVAVSESRAVEMASSQGLQCLLAFSAINADSAGILIELFEKFQELAVNFNYKVQFHLSLCFDYLEELVGSFSELHECHLGVMALLQSICRTFHGDLNCSVKIWELFGKLGPIIGSDADETIKKQFMALVSGMIRKLDSYGIEVIKAAFKTLSELAKCDPLSQWTAMKQGPNIEEKSVFQAVADLLKSKSQQVRIAAVSFFCEVFQAESIVVTEAPDNTVVQSSLRRKELFELVYTKLLEVYNVPAASDEENLEEAVNRTSTVISCLVKAIFVYPFNQKRVLFSLFLIQKLKSINVTLINRALKTENQAAARTLSAHILYSLEKWLRLKYTLHEFPFQLFDCLTPEEFFAKFRREISFQLFQYSEFDNSRLLEDFAKLTQTPVFELIKDCYGMIMSRLILGLAPAKEEAKSGKSPANVTSFNSSYNRLIQIFGNVVNTEDYLKECVDDVILNMISLTYDSKVISMWECSSIRIPEPEPPICDESKIQDGLDQLRHKLGLPRNISVIGHLVTTSPQKLYKTLLILVLRIHEAHDGLEKYWRLHHYSFFVNLLLAEPIDVFKIMRPYACQFTVYSYLRLLRDPSNTKDFVAALLHILVDYVESLTILSPDEMGLHFRAVVSQVITTSFQWPDTMPIVTKLLDFLLKTSGVTFSKHISSLDPFPSEVEAFRDYRDLQTEVKYGRHRSEWTLEREIAACLEQNGTLKGSGGNCTKERLKFIKQLLAQRKFDMESLVTKMSNKRFADECTGDKDTLHGLIQMLLGVITTSKQEEIILEAGRCLGEIGPIDLAVMVLPSSEAEAKLTSATKAIEVLLTSTAENLLSDEIELVVTTGQVLESLLRTTECLEIIEEKPEKTALTNTNPRLCQILIPFKRERGESEVGTTVTCNPSTLETQLQILDMTDCVTYGKWVTQLTCGIILALRPETSFLHRLLPLCRLKVGFCEEVLPFVVYESLVTSKSNPIVRAKLSAYFRKFFRSFSTLCQSSSTISAEKGRRKSSAEGESIEKPIHINKLALRCLLKVIQFLRLHEVPFERPNKTHWDNNFWVDINYLDLAKAAQFCGAFLSSILYTEIHAYSVDDKERLVQGFSSHEVPLRAKQTAAAEIEKLLLKAYINIGESDAVYGCGSARYSDFTSNVQHLAQMNQWSRSLAAYDSAHSSLMGSSGISTSLKELGLFSTLWTYLQGAEALGGRAPPQLVEIQYECAWRLSKWDLNCDKANYVRNSNGVEEEINGIPTIQKYIYESIQTALNHDNLRHSESIRRGLLSIVRDLKHSSLESAENLYPFLTQFQMCRIVEDFYSARSTGVPIESLLGNWQLLDKLGCSNLKFQEPVLYLRSILLKAFNDQQPSPTLLSFYDECVVYLLCKARDAGRLELAETCASNICSRSMSARKQVEVAKNHWARGEHDIALSILGRFLGSAGGQDHNPDIHATTLLLYGDWLSETKSENPNTIMEQYFTSSVKLYESQQAFGTANDISKAYVTLARYADSLYQNVSVYAKSEMFQEKVRTLMKAKAELDQMQAAIDARDEDGQRSIMLLRRQINLDAQETQAMQAESKRYLTIALKYYLRGLKYSSEHDLLIFRVIGLWLDNTNLKETVEIFNSEELPAHKFVIVLHQLCARLGLSGNNGVGSSEALQKTLLTCAQEHPYHTLPVLLAQALMDKDKEYMKIPVKKNVRVDAARHLIETLKAGPMRELVTRMESVWTALISLANSRQETKTPAPKVIPEESLLRKLRNISIVSIPTISIPLDPNSRYKNSAIGIHSFDPRYLLVGGINSPKKIMCIGTNGKKYNMLLKGQDDLRQDAVMQQVFAVMNKLLVAEAKTKARQLQVWTYKVVPLSQRSGLIEWCEETQTLGGYLLKNHTRYRPNDYEPAECRKKMTEVAAKPNQIRLEVYNDIMSKCKPVFRHFFFERFKDAGTFFERRLAYTRSVATSSMVGYILGLGDRHVLNILVDLKTAEFIHIDLGVAFEQGRILPTPETVPFRLTRDVVDGMGFCGVEGDFRRCCEMTLEVLRNNTEIILTILEVLLYDPLYIWTLSDDRVRKVQPGGRKPATAQDARVEEPMLKERNNSAARVLLRLRQKLVGVEEGISSGSTLGTAGHVSFLIQRACDISRLSRLFPGWQPYL